MRGYAKQVYIKQHWFEIQKRNQSGQDQDKKETLLESMESQQRVIKQMKYTNQIYGYFMGFKKVLEKYMKRNKEIPKEEKE